MKVSVLTPTSGRHDRLNRLCAVFFAQTHGDKELCILDDSATPWGDVPRDPRVRYVHVPERLTVGLKRDRLAEMATGDVIAHFDDDDYYAPAYLGRMLALLGDDDFVKLSSWFVYGEAQGAFGYKDAAGKQGVHFLFERGRSEVVVVDSTAIPDDDARAMQHSVLWGFGFSYVYRRALWQAVRFRDVGLGEDYAFVQQAQRQGFRCGLAADREGLALHVVHPTSMTRSRCQYLLPSFTLTRIFGDAVLAFLPPGAATREPLVDDVPIKDDPARIRAILGDLRAAGAEVKP